MLERAGAFVCAAGILTLLSGCQSVGPISIDQGRDRYNSIIQSTSKQQTFENIIRVAHNEPTVFMDVSEVDATTTFAGNVSGGVANIGARAGTTGGTLAGQTGAVTGGVTYSESPLVRYTPLLGQALVAQLATPVSPDVISALYGSAWNIAPLLDFSTAFLTLDSDEFFAVLNTIAELDYAGRLQLVAQKSDVTKAKDETASGTLTPDKNGSVVLQVTNKAASTGTSDALGIYFLPYHPHSPRKITPESIRQKRLWHLLLRLYANTQQKCLASKPTPGQPAGIQDSAVKAAADAAAKAAATAKADAGAADAAAIGVAAATAAKAVLSTVRSKPAPNTPKCILGPTDSIEVRTVPVTADKLRGTGITNGAPMMRTYSALGILKNTTGQPTPRISFLGLDDYLRIRDYEWNKQSKNDADLSYYTLLPSDLKTGDQPPDSPPDAELKAFNRIAVRWLTDVAKDVREGKTPHRVYLPSNPERQFDEFVNVNRQIGQLRRYILVITSETPPPADAFVAYLDRGTWYYIDRFDTISQKNFDLITLFMTMMAVPSTTPPIAPAITVGGGG